MSSLTNQSVLDNLELEQTWSAKVGPAYNPVASTQYWTSLRGTVREFGHIAPALGGWLSGLNDLPIPDGWTKGTVIHRARMLFDASIVNWAQGSRIAVEFDNRVSDGKGNNWNFSNQINLSEQWMWQVDPQTGKWTNVVQIDPMAALGWHDVAFENAVDFAAVKASFVSLTVDEVRYAAPSQFHGLTPMKANWTRGANLQVQMCRQTAGVALLYAKDIGMTWIAA